MIQNEKSRKIKSIYLYIGTIICLAIPSIWYLIKEKTVLDFNAFFTYFLRIPQISGESILGAILFALILTSSFILYFKIVRNRNKEFKNTKQIFLVILIVSILFGIMLPFTTSDIFYYMGTGQLDARYEENPYYTTVGEIRKTIQEDDILNRTGAWEDQIVIYGPLWALICKVLSFLSCNHVTFCLYLYKIAAIAIHLLTCYLLYKTTKRKMFLILYGLNPYILFEMITNVHNDLYLIFFVMLAIYFLKEKRNLFFMLFSLACAVAIKYVAVLIVPFMLLYYFKDYKILKRVTYCFISGIICIVMIGLFYLLYIKDFNILFNVLMQQDKIRESIHLLLLGVSEALQIPNIQAIGKTVITTGFLLVYIHLIILTIKEKKITVQKIANKCNLVIFLFLFFVITNLCPWYLSWIYPILFWVKAKWIKPWIYASFAYELCIVYNFALFSESYKIGYIYLFTIIILVIVFEGIEKRIKKGGRKLGQTCIN